VKFFFRYLREFCWVSIIKFDFNLKFEAYTSIIWSFKLGKEDTRDRKGKQHQLDSRVRTDSSSMMNGVAPAEPLRRALSAPNNDAQGQLRIPFLLVRIALRSTFEETDAPALLLHCAMRVTLLPTRRKVRAEHDLLKPPFC